MQELLGVDADDAACAINGLKLVLNRTDLPSPDDIFELARKGKQYYLQPACLLAADLLEKEEPGASAGWGELLAQTMVAFLLVQGEGKPGWYSTLVSANPNVVSDVLVPYATREIQKKAEPYIGGLSDFRREDGPAELSRIVIPELLREFPKLATVGQLSLLNRTLLPAALCHVDDAILEDLVSDRMADKGLDAGQRIAWLVAGMLLNPRQCLDQIAELIGNDAARAIDLGHAMEDHAGRRRGRPALPSWAVARLIELMAPHAQAERESHGVRDYTEEERLSDIVRSLIRQLASTPDPSAGEELLRLRGRSTLEPWAIALDAAHYDQVKVARAESFKHASVNAVAQALANKSPANARDMAALLIAQLMLLAQHIRFDNTNGLRLFWRDGDKKSKPKIENDCRDVLLGLLRNRMLPLGVDVEKEIHAAGDKRCDMSASTIIDGQRVVVPIEVKKEDHPAVWSAWQDQLINLYSTNPAAQGIGIYIVLWFGDAPRKSPSGKKAVDAKHMADLFSVHIPVEKHQQLSGLVLDLSPL